MLNSDVTKERPFLENNLISVNITSLIGKQKVVSMFSMYNSLWKLRKRLKYPRVSLNVRPSAIDCSSIPAFFGTLFNVPSQIEKKNVIKFIRPYVFESDKKSYSDVDAIFLTYQTRDVIV